MIGMTVQDLAAYDVWQSVIYGVIVCSILAVGILLVIQTLKARTDNPDDLWVPDHPDEYAAFQAEMDRREAKRKEDSSTTKNSYGDSGSSSADGD